MELLKELLDNYMILKEQDRDLYYEIKDNLSKFKPFIQDKLGYDVIIHQDFIKLEKFPGKVEGWMGVNAFENKIDYCFFVLLIMFLEEKGKEEQFILSHLTEYITSNFQEGKVDWTVYSTRKSLVRVLKFAVDLRLMKLNDGEEGDFAYNQTAEVLYENTGISKYIIRTFPIDIQQAKSYRDFVDFAWEDMDRERGTFRKNRVYRNLTLSPVLYNEGTEDQDFYYVKNIRNILENDFEKYLGLKLHIHKEGAMIILEEDDRCKDYFPYNSALSDITLFLNKMILDKLKNGVMKVEHNGTIELTKESYREMLIELRNSKASGWSKEYRESTDDYLYENLVDFMSGYSLLKEYEEKIIIYPLIGKVVGDYPEDYGVKENTNEG